MAFEFTETLTLEIPNVEEQLAAFSEAEGSSNQGLIIEVAAIHEGLTANFNHYSKAELEKAVESWVTPYPKPIIMNHDPKSEAVGRVMAAKMDVEEDGTAYTRLQIAITDPAAIKKVMDGRYLTGSVGGKADEATCSVCGSNWSEATAFKLPCKHGRGKTYKNKDGLPQVAYMEMKGLGFKEYSFVNIPADQRSSVRPPTSPDASESVEDSDGWVRPARVFALNMDKEEVFEYTESESRNLLSGMKKKDAGPLYHNLRGAFLSALASTESEENAVEDEVIEEQDEDILAVTEELSSDLAKVEEETVEEAAAPEADAEEEEPETDEEETPAEEEVPEEADSKKVEGQEKGKAQDVDPETSKGAPKNRESDEDTTVTEEEEVPEVVVAETDLSEQMQALESRVSELQTREQSLLEENVKLKAALKRNLAERVVDTKISLGMAERDQRDALLAEHVARSASSLADSLRDLASMSPVSTKKDYTQVPTIHSESMAVPTEVSKGDGKVLTVGLETAVTESKAVDPESVFVDALMGRRKL